MWRLRISIDCVTTTRDWGPSGKAVKCSICREWPFEYTLSTEKHTSLALWHSTWHYCFMERLNTKNTVWCTSIQEITFPFTTNTACLYSSINVCYFMLVRLLKCKAILGGFSHMYYMSFSAIGNCYLWDIIYWKRSMRNLVCPQEPPEKVHLKT